VRNRSTYTICILPELFLSLFAVDAVVDGGPCVVLKYGSVPPRGERGVESVTRVQISASSGSSLLVEAQNFLSLVNASKSLKEILHLTVQKLF